MTRPKSAHPAVCDAIVLAGGKGTRLSAVVHDVPKPLAPVAGRPFLDYVIEQFAASGVVPRVTLALGHLASKVIAHYETNPPVLPIEFSLEDAPLGTGGAMLQALARTRSDPVIACNGDSLVRIDLTSLLLYHTETDGDATITLVSVPDAGRYGRVSLEGRRVTGFAEKTGTREPGLVNAGIYVFGRRALERFRPGACSLEHDLLPRLVADGRVSAFVTDGPFLDIGLPETYAAGERFLSSLNDSIS